MTYTIAFKSNGGTGTMKNKTGTIDTSAALTANSFARPGYTFLGWSKDSEAVKATYTNKQSVKNLADGNKTITLYAVWKKTDATWTTNNVIHDEDMFLGDGNIKGSNGTTYDKNHVDSSYAKVDKSGSAGYFTKR